MSKYIPRVSHFEKFVTEKKMPLKGNIVKRLNVMEQIIKEKKERQNVNLLR